MVVVVVPVIMGMTVGWSTGLVMLLCSRLTDVKSSSGQNTIIMRDQIGRDILREACEPDRLKNGPGMFGKCVQHCRDKHVASNAADWVEMDVHGHGRRLRPCVGRTLQQRRQ